MKETTSIAFIGAGMMAEAMIAGLRTVVSRSIWLHTSAARPWADAALLNRHLLNNSYSI